jgi:CRISPR type I-D-associated protein Csc2
LNVVTTPLSIAEGTNTRRVAFLATKQKAAESRQLEQVLRTATAAVGKQVPECYLKDKLCLQCPRCGLFGGTNVESGSDKIGNIRHRIEYGTAFSLLPFADIGSATTFNGINDVTQQTGQTLNTRYAVIPASIFPSIVTLRSVTWREAVLAIKTLLACKSYGAESRIGGDARNTIVGLVAGWEEVITPLELTLELYDRCVAKSDQLGGAVVEAILQEYKGLAGNPNKVRIFSPGEVDELVKASAGVDLDKAWLDKAYADITSYRLIQANAGRKPK